MATGRIRNDLAEARIRNDSPSARAQFGAILTAGVDTTVSSGTPIGLLLALTYTNRFATSTSATFKGFSPTARIRNTD